MRGQKGQASVEWIGLLLLVALALAALARFAPSADGGGLASTLAHVVTKPQVGDERGGIRNDLHPPGRETFIAPPLLPPAGHAKRPERRPPSGLSLLRRARPRVGPALADRLRRGAGLAWRRAWLGCLTYERARYGFLHPESRFPGHTITRSEALRIANDCLSPVDLVRDWTLLTGR
jgi:hypothetical protein